MQQEIITCPFCSKGKIRILTTPRYRKYKKGGFKDISEQTEVLDDCPNCGISKEKIAKQIKKGSFSKKSDKKIIERLKKSGFSLEFVKKF